MHRKTWGHRVIEPLILSTSQLCLYLQRCVQKILQIEFHVCV